MAGIRLEHLGKVYDNGYAAVADVDLDIADGEFLVLVGPSGCGKSTVLRMVAGLEESTDGRILIDEVDVTHASPKDRDIAMVFQSYALYPHKTVWKNIAYPLELAKLPKDEIAARVEDVARILQLDGVLDRRPARLSGGQRQRVAMGRAIVRRPKAFLMDEPLSNLDAKLRVQMRAEIARIQRNLGVTTIYVTHDQVEAMTMGTRVAVLHEGTIQQCASPQTLYDHPANTFVAAFIGSPSMNLVAARAEVQDGSLVVVAGEHRIELGGEALSEVGGPSGLPTDGRVILGVRPEALAPGSGVAGPEPSLAVEVELVESLGSELLVHCAVAAETVTVDTREGADEAITRTGALLARLEPRAGVKAGERLSLTMERDAVHLFDAGTGRNLRPIPTVEAAWRS